MDSATIKEAVREVFEEERTAFWVPAERHYNDHRFVKGLRAVLVFVGTLTLTVVVPMCIYLFINRPPIG